MSVVAQSLSRHMRPVAPTGEWWPGGAARASGIAILALAGILTHVALRWGVGASTAASAIPLYVVLAAGGVPLILTLGLKLVRREFGSDLLAGISIIAAVLLGEYLAGALVVLMLSGGEALEAYAVGRASSVLQALARRMPLGGPSACRRPRGRASRSTHVAASTTSCRLSARHLSRWMAWSSRATA